MPKVATTASDVQCVHQGKVSAAGSPLLRVEGAGVLTRAAVEATTTSIAACGNNGGSNTPCVHLTVTNASSRLTIEGEPVVLADLAATTDSAPPGTASVADAGQSLLEVER